MTCREHTLTGCKSGSWPKKKKKTKTRLAALAASLLMFRVRSEKWGVGGWVFKGAWRRLKVAWQ